MIVRLNQSSRFNTDRLEGLERRAWRLESDDTGRIASLGPNKSTFRDQKWLLSFILISGIASGIAIMLAFGG